MQAMPSCLDFTTEFISLSAHEAVACRSLPVAVASLSQLLNFYSSGKAMPVNEVVVFRTLVTILSQEPANDADILKHMKRALARESEVGANLFFGKGEVGRRERNWLAANAWNFGVRTGQEKNYELSAELFKVASEIYKIVGDGETEANEEMVCKSLILSVSAIIADEKHHKGTLQEAEIRHAIELLGRAGKILTSSSSSSSSSIEPHFFFVYMWSASDLYSRLSDGGSQQLQVVKTFATSKSCNPMHLVQIGLEASQGPRSNPEVAILALNASLSALLASPSPDYQTVALVLRNLITVGSIHRGEPDDEGMIETYKQAHRVMVGLKEGKYPSEEAKWLAMTAWNRAAVPVKLGQVETAKKWMSMGLEVAEKVPGMQMYRSCMEEYLGVFEKKLNGQDHDQSRTCV